MYVQKIKKKLKFQFQNNSVKFLLKYFIYYPDEKKYISIFDKKKICIWLSIFTFRCTNCKRFYQLLLMRLLVM